MMQMQMDAETYTVPDVCRMLNERAGSLWARIITGDVPSLMLDGKRVIPASTVNKLIAQNGGVTDDSELLSLEDAAKFLGITEMRVSQLIKDGSLPSRSIGRRKYVVRARSHAHV